MEMQISFPGNQKVQARYKGFTVETDQPANKGGDGSAPSPFDLFLVSLGTCAGFFTLRFLQQREIPTDNASIIMHVGERDPQTHLVRHIDIELKLPADFPEKYRAAVVRAAELCIVKQHIEQPPAFRIFATIG